MKHLGRIAPRGVYACLQACHFGRAAAIAEGRLCYPGWNKAGVKRPLCRSKNKQNGWSKRELSYISRVAYNKALWHRPA
jgi:hypothetical protein